MFEKKEENKYNIGDIMKKRWWKNTENISLYA